MPLLIVILGILLLFVLIAKFKLNAFISFIIVCVFVGVFQGMELDRIVEAIQIGMGNTLGFLVMILGLGAMLGKLVSDSGAAQRITSKLVSSFGIKYIQWAVVVAGFIVGIPMFYSVGFVILIPLVFTVAASTGLNNGIHQLTLASGVKLSFQSFGQVPQLLEVAEKFNLRLVS